jgi:XTP/dITP diphosphohydrolase
MTRLFVATTNQGKLREIRELLADAPVTLFGLADLPSIEEPEETGRTFEENARLKALYYDAHARRSDAGPVLTVAEDSGLVIDALDGDPGVHSARFLGPDVSYSERFREVYRRLGEQPGRPRTARFVCALTLVGEGRVLYETTGVVEGEIAPAPSGEGGFGYDPIFYYPPFAATLADVTQGQKSAVAHRGYAFRALGEWLQRERAADTKEPVQTKNGER